MDGILNDIDLCCHSLAKWPEAWRDELEFHLKQLLVHDGWDVDLDLEVKHVVRSDTL